MSRTVEMKRHRDQYQSSHHWLHGSQMTPDEAATCIQVSHTQRLRLRLLTENEWPDENEESMVTCGPVGKFMCAVNAHIACALCCHCLTDLICPSFSSQRVWRGHRVRRLLVSDVRDEFAALMAEVDRKASVARVRRMGATVESMAMSLAHSHSHRLQYARDTLCRPTVVNMSNVHRSSSSSAEDDERKVEEKPQEQTINDERRIVADAQIDEQSVERKDQDEDKVESTNVRVDGSCVRSRVSSPTRAESKSHAQHASSSSPSSSQLSILSHSHTHTAEEPAAVRSSMETTESKHKDVRAESTATMTASSASTTTSSGVAATLASSSLGPSSTSTSATVGAGRGTQQQQQQQHHHVGVGTDGSTNLAMDLEMDSHYVRPLDVQVQSVRQAIQQRLMLLRQSSAHAHQAAAQPHSHHASYPHPLTHPAATGSSSSATATAP